MNRTLSYAIFRHSGLGHFFRQTRHTYGYRTKTSRHLLAPSIIKLFRGPGRLYKALAASGAPISRPTVYRWLWAPPMGTGGAIPYRTRRYLHHAGMVAKLPECDMKQLKRLIEQEDT